VPRIGLGVPRRVGDPSLAVSSVDHRSALRLAQMAEQLDFDSVWVPDHFFYEWPPDVFEPYPEAWTLLTAIGVTTRRVQIGSLVLAAGFRHPAVVAKMAGALQGLTDGRLVLGIGAGNQIAEHGRLA
jgi:alkanesulfonate monooxygenase SsuD/methylene tetrahydromethanopterin reductase-like flavin-dependent oxidoreductase (luciferase family)